MTKANPWLGLLACFVVAACLESPTDHDIGEQVADLKRNEGPYENQNVVNCFDSLYQKRCKECNRGGDVWCCEPLINAGDWCAVQCPRGYVKGETILCA